MATKTKDIRVAQGGDLDRVSMRVFPFGKRPENINDRLVSVSWTESANNPSVEASLTITNDDGFARVGLAPGTWVVMRVWDPTRDAWARQQYHLYVWDRELRDRLDGTASASLFDVTSFLSRMKARTWVFKGGGKKAGGWTASEIAEKVLSDYSVSHRIIPTEFKIPFLRIKATPLEMIIAAYTEDRLNTKQRYRIQTRGRTFVIDRLKPQYTTWYLSEHHNLQSANYKESLDGVATVVRAISLGDNSIPVNSARAENPTLIGRYGRLVENIEYDQTNIKNGAELKKLAKTRLAKVGKTKKEIRLEAYGTPNVRAADAVFVVDSGTGLKSLYFIDDVTHTLSPGSHSMSASLSLEVILPLRAVTEQERTEELELEEDVVTYGPDGKPIVGGEGGDHTNPYPILPTKRGASAFMYPDAEGAHSKSGTRYHGALDWFAPAGTPISCPQNGIVVKVKKDARTSGQVFGDAISVQVSDGYVFVMRHTRASVSQGQVVTRGQRIGTVSPWSDGSEHVHLEVWKTLAGGYNIENMVDPNTLNWTTAPNPKTTTNPDSGTGPIGGLPGAANPGAQLAVRALGRPRAASDFWSGDASTTPQIRMDFATDPSFRWADAIEQSFDLSHGSRSRYRSPSANAGVGGSSTSRHMTNGGAADMSGSASRMAQCAIWAIRSRQFAEVFYDPLGFYWDTTGGTARIVRGAIGGHSDHVHLSYGRPR